MPNAPLFFLHFPRTAGTTVDEIFFNNYAPEEVIKIYNKDEYEKYKFVDPDKLAAAKYITGHLLLTQARPPQFCGIGVKAFTFLRDPLKRLYSEYIFLKTWKNQHLYEYLNSKNITFPQYIKSGEKLLKYRGKNFMTRCLSGNDLDKANLAESLAQAKDNLQNNFLCFGIQERFMESMLLLSQKVNLKNILHQKRNSLNYANNIPPMTEEEKDIAREYNQADLDLYKFALNLFEKRVKEGGPEFQTSLKNYKFLNAKYQKLSDLLYASVKKNGDEPIKLAKDENW